jgi:hypothetical protein
MSDLTDFSNYNDQVSKALAKANELNKTAVFEALSGIGVTSVSVEFDGEGDSGQIHDVTVRAGEMRLELPSTPLTVHSRVGNDAEMSASETTLPDAIEMLCYDYLALEHGGWENSDGAYGEFHFDVAARSIRLDFNARFTDVTSYSHEF